MSDRSARLGTRRAACAALATLLLPAVAAAQAPSPPTPGAAVSALPVRAIGPALMGGRIADVVVHPRDRSTWYVAVGSGGVWKTTNAGVTFTPIFDDQPSYSIGTLALDPANPDVVWVGTGENVSGRHVGWGDGVYRSRDGGRTWQRVGLPQSQHIGRILIDPRDPDVVLVAAEGPLWSAGGERGVYRTADGGATWSPVLQVDEHTGVTDLEFDPANPDVVYAAAYQRRRHVWGFMGGGPGSGIHKSTDNGKTWRKVTTGLPTGDMGKIGLAVTAADPSVVYATIEAGPEQRGFYRSRDRGESWEKRNGYISGGTGPHYYQELVASPTNVDLVYQMDVFLQVTRDGGKTFSLLETGHDKHSDNHALWIDPADGRHLLVGTDGGLYESFDEGTRWRHFPNLPVSQFYKVAVNDRVPFYDVLAGAQDLGTLHGPSRTRHREGVRNQDWYVPLGADGYGVAFDPRDPDTMYLMWQEGMLTRKDRRNEETVMIRPTPAPGDPPERWNWDSPLLVSPHDPARLYFGSQRLWRSDDRGDSWTPISGDLTLGQSRYGQRFMGRVWSVDALHDTGAMSKYATTTAIAESPREAGVLVVGTDDGLVQVSSDGGRAWARASALPGLPPQSFINDVEASPHAARTIFVVADAHKTGDFSPYVFASDDLGRTWRSIAGNLPKGTIAWAIQQDPVEPRLLFLGTEFGLYWTPDGGTTWHKLTGGVPTIPFRDVKIQARAHDLVAASFGRGIYVLDDYTPLREVARASRLESTLFPVRDAWWYVPYAVGQAPGRPELGSDDFSTPNPADGALLTYYLDTTLTTAADARRAEEKTKRDKGDDVPVPGFERLRAEALEASPKVLVAIADATGRRVRLIPGPTSKGVHRVNWDLRAASPEPIVLDPPAFRPPWADEEASGPLVPPGRYTATLLVVANGAARQVGQPRSFEVRAVDTLTPGTDPAAVTAFQTEGADLQRRVSAAIAHLRQAREQTRYLRAALAATPRADAALAARVEALVQAVAALQHRLTGDPARQRLNESDAPSITDRLGLATSTWATRQAPTATHKRALEVATTEFASVSTALRTLDADMASVQADLAAAGAPYIPGRPTP